MYISLCPLCRGCQGECQLTTAVLDICWLGTKLRLQIPFTQSTKHPSNGNFFLTLDGIRSIFQWGKLLKRGRLISIKKKRLLSPPPPPPPLAEQVLFTKLNKNYIRLQKICMGLPENPFLCDSKDTFLKLFDTLFMKILLKIRFVRKGTFFRNILWKNLGLLGWKFCFENIKIMLYQNAPEPLQRP